MLQVLLLLLRTLLASARSRRDVALETLVLRHQLQVALRTNRLWGTQIHVRLAVLPDARTSHTPSMAGYPRPLKRAWDRA